MHNFADFPAFTHLVYLVFVRELCWTLVFQNQKWALWVFVSLFYEMHIFV